MHINDPRQPPEPRQQPADPQEPPPLSPGTFDVRELETMLDEDADAEWLRHPEAWHMH